LPSFFFAKNLCGGRPPTPIDAGASGTPQKDPTSVGSFFMKGFLRKSF
jgi:hypothetical protein